MESIPVVFNASFGIHPGLGLSERAVRIPTTRTYSLDQEAYATMWFRWFCEPAYEKLRGTQEGIVNSRLYSEKAYVLSCAFVRRALEAAPLGLEKEIESFYIERGILRRVIADAKDLIEISGTTVTSDTVESDTNDTSWEDKAIPRLSAGAILMLQRTVAKLEALSEARQSCRR